ncbi:MAG TPA: DUF4139 domain-containing protein [Caulobacteraceae bacterium]|jgi:hypothetical protein|nr:DUF4139 domain-containing protein [Caulobacteraceae bacterium]
MRRLLFSAAALALAGAAHAADQPPQIALTVYNSNLALVEDVRTLNPPAGRSTIELKDVSASIRPETATLTGKGLSVIEQNFDYDLLSPAKMMEKAVGKQIQIVRTNPGNGQQTTETATVLAVNDGVVLQIGNRVEILREDSVPTRVVFDSIPASLRANPTLSVTVNADGAGPRAATLRYLTNGLSWQADYVAMYDEKKALADVQGWVTLTNKSGTSFEKAATQLVAGNFNLVNSDTELTLRERREARSQSGVAAGAPADGADYYIYPLPGRVTVADNQTKQVGFLGLQGAPTTKAYRYEAYGFDSLTTPRHVDVALKLTNAGAALPAGVVRVYMHDDAGEVKFVGEAHIDHTPADSQLEFKIGQAFDITVTPTVTSADKSAKTRTRYAMSYLFHNGRAEPVTVEFEQVGLGLGGKVEAESLPSRRLDADTLGWSVPVPANGETTLTFTADTGA